MAKKVSKKKPAKKKKASKKPASKKKAAKKKPGPAKGTGGRPRRDFHLDHVPDPTFIPDPEKPFDQAKNINPDREVLESACAFQATQKEVASWFGIGIETLSRRIKESYGITFEELFKEKRLFGKVSLRRAQFQVAMDGNPTMLIWLGKQYLGQKDKVHTSGAGSTSGTVKFYLPDNGRRRPVAEKKASPKASRKASGKASE